jgi:hypothetical protein
MTLLRVTLCGMDRPPVAHRNFKDNYAIQCGVVFDGVFVPDGRLQAWVRVGSAAGHRPSGRHAGATGH